MILNVATYIGALSATISGVVAAVVLILTVLGAIHASIGVWILVAVLFRRRAGADEVGSGVPARMRRPTA